MWEERHEKGAQCNALAAGGGTEEERANKNGRLVKKVGRRKNFFKDLICNILGWIMRK